jgi:hypothetical protein
MVVVISIAYRFYKTAKLSLLEILNFRRTRYSILKKNRFVNTALESIKKILRVSSLFLISFINLRIKIPTRKSDLLSLWVIKSIQANQKIILTTLINPEIILHLNL